MTIVQARPGPYDPPRGATAQRPSWLSLPADLRALVEEHLGQPVMGADSQGGGFTNGFASRLRLADGSRVFVKAVSRRQSPDVFASRPWQPEELRAVLDMLTPLAAALTPSPAALPHLETTADIDHGFSFWRRLADGEASDDPRLGSKLWRGHLAALAALEGDWATLAAGDTAVHFDMREDNLLLTEDGQVLVCDWNWLSLAAPWVDLVGLLISVHGDGLDADALLAEHPLGRDVPPRAVDAFLAALAGYFTEAAAQPAFPHSPWIRTHQAWWRDATLSWLALRLRL